MAEHTPGPWRVDGREIIYDDTSGLPYVVAKTGLYVLTPNMDANAEANARLIAAAPDLLEALEAVLHDSYHQLDSQMTDETERKVLAAIAKAKGETA